AGAAGPAFSGSAGRPTTTGLERGASVPSTRRAPGPGGGGRGGGGGGGAGGRGETGGGAAAPDGGRVGLGRACAGAGCATGSGASGGTGSAKTSAAGASASIHDGLHAPLDARREPRSARMPADAAEKDACTSSPAKLSPGSPASFLMSGAHGDVPTEAAASRMNQSCLPVSPMQASAGGPSAGGSKPRAALRLSATMAQILGPDSVKSYPSLKKSRAPAPRNLSLRAVRTASKTAFRPTEHGTTPTTPLAVTSSRWER